jgi:hypothetical protein
LEPKFGILTCAESDRFWNMEKGIYWWREFDDLVFVDSRRYKLIIRVLEGQCNLAFNARRDTVRRSPGWSSQSLRGLKESECKPCRMQIVEFCVCGGPTCTLHILSSNHHVKSIIGVHQMP